MDAPLVSCAQEVLPAGQAPGVSQPFPVTPARQSLTSPFRKSSRLSIRPPSLRNAHCLGAPARGQAQIIDNIL